MSDIDLIEQRVNQSKAGLADDVVQEWISMLENKLDRPVGRDYDIKGYNKGSLPEYYIHHKNFFYRNFNGRLRSNVISHESTLGRKLDYRNEEDQDFLHKELITKNKKEHNDLIKLLIQNGQEDPLIARCDGVLINGNRRLAAIRELIQSPSHRDLQDVKVVLLPKDTSELDIRKIEQKLQIQPTGKAKYDDFDHAILKIENERDLNWSIIDQLREDDTYAGLSTGEFNKEYKKFMQKFILPLKFTNEYLDRLNANDKYELIKGKSWTAIAEFAKYFDDLTNENSKARTKLEQLNVNKELPRISDAFHRVVRKQDFGTEFRDLNGAWRVFKDCLKKKKTRKILYDMLEVDMPTYPEETTTVAEMVTFDEKWKANDNQGVKVENILKHAKGIYQTTTEDRNIIDEIQKFADFIYSDEMESDSLEEKLDKFNNDELKVLHDLFASINDIIPIYKNITWNKYKGKEEEFIGAVNALKEKFNSNN